MTQLLNYSVLYVEDDPDAREAMHSYLARRFREVRLANNGQSGWQMYQESRPDILITDIQMPVMDGIELLRKIREKDKKTPVIITSAYSDTEYITNAIDLSVQVYLKKPVDRNELAEALASCIEKQTQPS